MRLDVETTQPSGARAVSNDGEAVANDAGNAVRALQARKEGKCRAATDNFGDLGIVDAGEGHADVCK